MILKQSSVSLCLTQKKNNKNISIGISCWQIVILNITMSISPVCYNRRIPIHNITSSCFVYVM